MSSGDSKVPPPPNYAKTYQEGIDVFLKNYQDLLARESEARNQFDPERIAQQQALQEQFGPIQVQQQLDALHQFDPESAAIRARLGQNVYDTLGAGGDPATQAVYGEMQKRVLGDLQSGYDLPDDYARELEQSLRGAQSARGNIFGQGPALAESSFKGKAALDLYQQRLANAGGFLQQKSPGQLATENAGNFLSGPTPTQQSLALTGIQPDRSMAYVTPTAGNQGVNFGLSNYQNLLAQQQLLNNQRNPWGSAATGAASGAAAGSAAGPWGAVIGGLVGGAAGYYSDSRLKENIRHICKSALGFPMVCFNFKGRKETFVGALAEDVRAIRPDAVSEENGFLKVDYSKTDVPFYELKGALCLG